MHNLTTCKDTKYCVDFRKHTYDVSRYHDGGEGKESLSRRNLGAPKYLMFHEYYSKYNSCITLTRFGPWEAVNRC